MYMIDEDSKLEDMQFFVCLKCKMCFLNALQKWSPDGVSIPV